MQMVEENCNRTELNWGDISSPRWAMHKVYIGTSTFKALLLSLVVSFLVVSLQGNLFADCETSLTFLICFPYKKGLPTLSNSLSRSVFQWEYRARIVTGLYPALIMCHMKCFSILQKIEIIVFADSTCALCWRLSSDEIVTLIYFIARWKQRTSVQVFFEIQSILTCWGDWKKTLTWVWSFQQRTNRFEFF